MFRYSQDVGISLHRGPIVFEGNLVFEGEARIPEDFERRMKGALGWGFSLSDEAPWRGPLGGGSFTGNPGRYVQTVSGCGHLSP